LAGGFQLNSTTSSARPRAGAPKISRSIIASITHTGVRRMQPHQVGDLEAPSTLIARPMICSMNSPKPNRNSRRS
jgi:hypothetical protein